LSNAQRAKGVQPGFQVLDARKVLIHEVDRRQAARGNLRRPRVDRTKGGVIALWQAPLRKAAAILRHAVGLGQGAAPSALRATFCQTEAMRSVSVIQTAAPRARTCCCDNEGTTNARDTRHSDCGGTGRLCD
jgi:hypothetical protein